jgi:hypothetical protein
MKASKDDVREGFFGLFCFVSSTHSSNRLLMMVQN